MLVATISDSDYWMNLNPPTPTLRSFVISVPQTSGEKAVSGSIDFLGTVGIWALIIWIIYKAVKAYKKGKREGKPE